MSVGLQIVGDLAAAHIRPGDVLVVKTRQFLTPNASDRLREIVAHKFPGHEILILPNGIELQIARRASADDPGG